MQKSVFVYMLMLVFFIGGCWPSEKNKNHTGWKAGTARAKITPEKNIWQAGYASREHAAEGKITDLWAKALALEDSTGNRAVLVTTDIIGFPKPVADRVRTRLQAEFNLSPAQIILNSSHTHSGPVLADGLVDIYPIDINGDENILAYTKSFENNIVKIVANAIQSLQPATLYFGNGVTRFQVNRRNNNERTLASQTELKGPNDFAVPVIKIVDGQGNIKAVAFGYACHPTVLSGYDWCGDYPGFAQIELEKMYPGTEALFFQGAGGNQNPLPRRSIPLAKQYGLTLAAAVERVLSEDMKKLSPTLVTAYSEIDLPLLTPPTKEELQKVIDETDVEYIKRWATRLKKQIESGKPLITSYPYPLQVWKIGDVPVMSLGGELLVEYSLGLKNMFGRDIIVMGYCNDVMGYIPPVTVLREGGYEGATSQMAFGLPCPWSEEIEPLIYRGMENLASQAGIVPSPAESK